MKRTRVNFFSGQLVLEGILAIPKGTGPFPAVVVCHPHPLYGGSMENNVVNSLSEAVTRASLVSLKFNFRGVGGSQGEFSQGIGEQEDVRAAIAFLGTRQEIDSTRIGVVGYSAGAAFALPAIFDNFRVQALAAVSPPLGMLDFGFLNRCLKPKFFVSGSRDELVPAAQFLQFCQSLAEPKEYELVEGADHFWWGYESELAVKVSDFFSKVL
jgi:hypothetical protein